MGKKTPDPQWYVYVAGIGNEIRKFNVFNSFNFDTGCRKSFKKYKLPDQRKELEESIRGWAKYSFWSKSEYEIVLTNLFHSERFKEKQIDVYDQLEMNWDTFIEYTIKHKAYFLRREKKEH